MSDTDKNNYKNKMLVKYGKMGYLGWFDHNETHIPHTPSKVVIKTERGLEIGTLVGEHSYKGGTLKIKCHDLKKYFEKEDTEYPIGDSGVFVRFATPEDTSEQRHIKESAKEELETCLKYVKELELPMKVVDFEHIFGGERIVFYFVSDGRVDFRELVKRLAKDFQTRIEMRQIGARDEARIISDYETCGQQCCCSKFLKILKPVNMRMAKVQKATLDPSKISGHCGRLRCCLRYEDQTYKDLKAMLPNRSTRVRTETGEGKVVDYQILTQLVKILYDDGKFEAVPLENVKILENQSQKKQPATERKQRSDNSQNKRTGNKPPNQDKSKQQKAADGKPTSEKQSRDNKQRNFSQKQGASPASKNKFNKEKSNTAKSGNNNSTKDSQGNNKQQENKKSNKQRSGNRKNQNRNRKPQNNKPQPKTNGNETKGQDNKPKE